MPSLRNKLVVCTAAIILLTICIMLNITQDLVIFNASTKESVSTKSPLPNANVIIITPVVSTYNNLPFTNFSRTNKQRFCNITGCTYLEKHADVTRRDRIMWEKIPPVLEALQAGYEIIWMLDFDTIIMDPELIIPELVDDKHDVFLTRDCNGINAGSMLLRNTDWTMELVQQLMKFRERMTFFVHEEQGAISKLYQKNWRNAKDHFKFLNQTQINAYPKELGCTKYPYVGGKYPVLHFASCFYRKKCADLFKRYGVYSKV